MEAPDMHSEAIFRHLVQRNAINWHAERWVGDVVLTSQPNEEIRAAAQRWVDDLQRGRSSPHVDLSVIGVLRSGEPIEIRRATLLVGSPKTRRSTSNSLGGYLFEQLQERSVQTETIYPHTVLRSPRRRQAMLEVVENSDLVMLAFPIYVDTLPAPVIETLQSIAEHRRSKNPRRQLFAAIANCGFPEAYQCDSALAVCENFALQAGFEWAGGLAMGGGEAVNGASLVDGGGKTIRMRQSLELAAEALAQGQAVPPAAREGLATPLIPHWLYRLTGWLRWNRWAESYGAKKMLKHRPYLAQAK
jgi:hypothetical protein